MAAAAAGQMETEIAPNDVEWQYEMRRVMQEIVPKLWLGPYASGKRKAELAEAGITHIMIVRSAIERIIAAKYPDEFKYHIVEIPDVPTVSLLPYLAASTQFIDEGRRMGGVLIHCDSGISRSAAITIAYVMHDLKMSYDQAFQYVSDRRCCVHPNLGFMHQLSEYEHMSQMLGNVAVAPSREKKRQLEDDECVDDDMSEDDCEMQEDI